MMWHTWADGYPGQTAAIGVILIVAIAIITIGGRLIVSHLSKRQET